MWSYKVVFLTFPIFQRNDIAMAVAKYDQFDFLIDIVPRDELKPQKRQVSCSIKIHVITLVDDAILPITQ